ncbi:hypothetical protein DTX80_02995 [Bacilli bacterium]|uniref:hypothetical protein n=1 Tax=Oceanobacillus TaxID=182709 RepID=UPI00062118A0|nr:hypothetical protein WH51_07895 [Bacilli bacterium VT-13-104]PZD88292.1 hypothetical protein DEJ64_03705 [Bacilli bacterium]PZD90387.1 hypothetical protein DEJ60_02845 [Bacilli bacterium]PZD92173.1 hypothetical protein DEJ66_03225 [Bacilli bacterium]RCO07151.1 hypothetical protein DTX80_02995 [Bacilli bacterium]
MGKHIAVMILLLFLPFSQLFLIHDHNHANTDQNSIMENSISVEHLSIDNGGTDKIVHFITLISITLIHMVLNQSLNFLIIPIRRKILFTPIFYQLNYVIIPLNKKPLYF